HELSQPFAQWEKSIHELNRPFAQWEKSIHELNRHLNHTTDFSRRLHVQTENSICDLTHYFAQRENSIRNFTHHLEEIVRLPTLFRVPPTWINPSIKTQIVEQPVKTHCPDNSNRSFGKKVFIACGSDEEAKQTVARRIERLGLETIIIDEQPNGAQTKIEKLEKYTDDVSFTVVLLTPDDVSKAKDEFGEPNFRPNQDVILELGILIGKHGRDQICLLYKGELELPSYINDINSVLLDANGEWILSLIREMEDAGLPIDMHRLI
ncbi:hypothetical protein F4Y93_02905, partial [Candidatus Poribacteria bacterium]|nr:hypothetical protein [Candidatus Poribacteria bacterium]